MHIKSCEWVHMSAYMQHGLYGIGIIDLLLSGRTDSSDMYFQSMLCCDSSYERSVRHVHIESCEWVHMSAYMQHGLHGIGSIELHSGCTDSSDMQSQSMQCRDSSYERSVRHVHIGSSEWVHMSAYMQHGLHGIGSIELHSGRTDSSYM